MLVPSMTYEEVYRELDRDHDNLQRWWNHQVDNLHRRMIKRDRTAFPVASCYFHTSPRRIQYLIIALIGDKRLKWFHTICVAIDGKTVYMYWLNTDSEIRRMVMLPHMWQRYKERMQFEETGTDIIRRFFCRNFDGSGTKKQEIVARSVRYNGEEHLSMVVNDGALMGQMEGDIFVARTFITYEMSCGRQQEEFAKLKHDMYSPGLEVHPYYRYLPTPDLPPIPKKLLEKIKNENKK